jgi:hypothetical protein
MPHKPVLDDNVIDLLTIFIIVVFIVLYILNTGHNEL